MIAESSAPTPRELEQQAEIELLRAQLAGSEQRVAELTSNALSAAAAARIELEASQQAMLDLQISLDELHNTSTEAAAAHLAVVAAGQADLTASEAQNDQLEKLVIERTAEIEQMQATLLQTQKMEAVGQLTGGIAHDFNNMLAAIMGSLEMLQVRLAQGRINQLDRYITIALGAGNRAATLTHRLLAFSRRQALESKPCNINQLVAGMEELIRQTLGRQIHLETAAAGGLWTVLIDPHQFETALLNLCINARDAMPEGGKLTIETANRWLDERGARERDVPAGQFISLCVTDSGVGMTSEIARRAFEPFFTTKPFGEGTGLGLSMTYGFTRQSGGQTRIYSEIGKGTMVCLYLPRRHDETSASYETEIVPASRPIGNTNATVLVVDDEPAVRMLVAELLSDLGYASIEVADGGAALKVLQSEVRIDLLITDVGLPNNLNGRQVADAGRTIRPDLKVLFITGYAENAVLHHGHLSHDMHVMMKPFALDALSRRVTEIISSPPSP